MEQGFMNPLRSKELLLSIIIKEGGSVRLEDFCNLLNSMIPRSFKTEMELYSFIHPLIEDKKLALKYLLTLPCQ